MSARDIYNIHLDLGDMRLLGKAELDIFREWRDQNNSSGYFGNRLEEARMDTAQALGSTGLTSIRAVAKKHADVFAASVYPDISVPTANLQTVSDVVLREVDLTAMLAMEKCGMDALLVPEESAINRLVVLAEHSPEAETVREYTRTVPHLLVASQTLVRALVEVNSFASPVEQPDRTF